jgi:hypothetical protein
MELAVDESAKANGIATWNRERILDALVRIVVIVGTVLPAAYVTSIGLSDLSNRLARLDVVGWMADYASIASVPWEVIATILIIARWRDLPQRFWITYCVNGVLAYVSLPIYQYHFGIFW